MRLGFALILTLLLAGCADKMLLCRAVRLQEGERAVICYPVKQQE
jgi:hypothetical protein